MTDGLILVGGGLANCLIALRLARLRPKLNLRLIERGDRLGGNHVWSFHDGDLTAEQRAWLAPLVERSWSTHEVRFPGLRRKLSGGYHALTSERLNAVVSEVLGSSLRLQTEVTELAPRSVRLGDGTAWHADAVVDGRGARRTTALDVAYQKFVGQWLALEQPHGLGGPILMDATVEQLDGYRFVYTLPFDEHLVHVEDTRYSDTPRLDGARLATEIRRYADRQGWKVRSIVREERGVLPIVLGGDIASFWNESDPGVARSGMRAALFHPTTGYALPEAVRLADAIARRADISAAALFDFIHRRSVEGWRRNRFYRFLNRMLFRAADPGRRYVVLQRFYGLPEPLIRRFYAGRLTAMDRVRLLTGRPPVPLRRAVKCVFDRYPAAASGSVS